MGDFKRLAVWKKAHALALGTHRIATRIRGPENAALRSQMIRSALSIPTNIVEGRGQQSAKDFARFVKYSINSASELEYLLIFAQGIRAVPEREFKALVEQLEEVRKMLYGLLAHLKARIEKRDSGA